MKAGQFWYGFFILHNHNGKKMKTMERKATAQWSGNLKDGTGKLQTESRILNNTPYSYKTRFEGEQGTNPEELLAAAHAGCFTMAVASAITRQGLLPDTLATEATITMEGLRITGANLSITGVVPGMNHGEFEQLVSEAAKNCIISKALSVPITYQAQFS
jgi:osmotically inducible protein OsmC